MHQFVDWAKWQLGHKEERKAAKAKRHEAAGGKCGLPTTRSRLQEFFERVDGEAGVAHDTPHGEGIDRIVARDG